MASNCYFYIMLAIYLACVCADNLKNILNYIRLFYSMHSLYNNSIGEAGAAAVREEIKRKRVHVE